MTPRPQPSRRHFLLTTSAALVPVSGCRDAAASHDRRLSLTSLAQVEHELARLAQAKAVLSATAWNWGQTLAHCAQSIEYAITGYPQAKSALFQRTVGTAAFQVFAWRGHMTHDLAEPIPGAPTLPAGTDARAALTRLRQAIAAFRQWQGPLKPHFAYGALDKRQFELAHAMHVANHLSLLRAAPE